MKFSGNNSSMYAFVGKLAIYRPGVVTSEQSWPPAQYILVVASSPNSCYACSDLSMVAMMVMMASMATPGHVLSSWL
jgi:hypothetical protein